MFLNDIGINFKEFRKSHNYSGFRPKSASELSGEIEIFDQKIRFFQNRLPSAPDHSSDSYGLSETQKQCLVVKNVKIMCFLNPTFSQNLVDITGKTPN